MKIYFWKLGKLKIFYIKKILKNSVDKNTNLKNILGVIKYFLIFQECINSTTKFPIKYFFQNSIKRKLFQKNI